MPKIKWELLEKALGTWAPEFKFFWREEGFDRIFAELKARSEKGEKIAPESDDVFKCFRATPFNELRTIMIGMCPYHSLKDGEVIADGILMSCSKTGILQPSLEKFYEAVENELYKGLCLPCYKNPDLLFLAEQGVLMFNTALTTKIGVAKAHQDIWEEFTRYVLSEVIINKTDVPIVMLGKEAADFVGCVNPKQPVFQLHHPAHASYKQTKWDSKGVFKAVNELLEKPINWMEEIK